MAQIVNRSFCAAVAIFICPANCCAKMSSEFDGACCSRSENKQKRSGFKGTLTQVFQCGSKADTDSFIIPVADDELKTAFQRGSGAPGFDTRWLQKLTSLIRIWQKNFQRGSGAGLRTRPRRLMIQGNSVQVAGGSTEAVNNGSGWAHHQPRGVFLLAVGCPETSSIMVGIDQRNRCVGEDVEREVDDGQGAEDCGKGLEGDESSSSSQELEEKGKDHQSSYCKELEARIQEGEAQ